MITNEYALKFAREAYEDALHRRTVEGFTCDITDEQLANLKAAYDRERQIYTSRMPKRVA